MVRQVEGAGSRLDFTFGNDPDYRVNPFKVAFDKTGRIYSSGLTTTDVSSDSYKYSSPKNGYATLSSHAFHPMSIDSNTDWVNADSAFFRTAGGGGAVASIQLPHGAVVTSFGCEISDVNSTFDLSCRLLRQGYPGHSVLASVTSSGSGGIGLYTTTSIALATVDNLSHGYSVEVLFPGNITGGGLSIRRVFVKYTLIEIP